jgi:hypothetical protein
VQVFYKPPFGCAITSPAEDAVLVSGVPVIVTGTITEAGTVNVYLGAVLLGAAVVSGLGWSYSWTPLEADQGAQTLNASATAAASGLLADAPSVDVSVGSPFAAAPAIFLAGQSNAGNRDLTPGTVDARVSLTWTADGVTFTGPGAMAVQVSDGHSGHSFEWQCGSDLAAQYGSDIIVGKYWADGSVIKDWLVSNTLKWPPLALALENFAVQCVTANVSQVDFGWCQGESNALNATVADLATFEAETNTLFDTVKYLLEGFGLTVRFSVLKTNGNLTTGPGDLEINASQLATVRAAQDNLGVTRTDTSVVSFDTVNLGGALHYENGDTNLCGSLWAESLIAQYIGDPPALAEPPTIEDIMGSSAIIFDYDSRSITGLSNNAPVVSWPDLGSGAHTGAPVGTARPLYKTAGLVGPLETIPEVEFDGIDDTMAIPGVTLPAPGITPLLSIWVGRQKAWTITKRIWGSTASYCGISQADGTPYIGPQNSANIAGSPLAINTFGRVENYFSHQSTNYQQVVNARVNTGDLGDFAIGAISMCPSYVATVGANVGYLKWVGLNRAPTAKERNQLRGYGAATYGLAVWGYNL